jgi:hypothetical protein
MTEPHVYSYINEDGLLEIVETFSPWYEQDIFNMRVLGCSDTESCECQKCEANKRQGDA